MELCRYVTVILNMKYYEPSIAIWLSFVDNALHDQ